MITRIIFIALPRAGNEGTDHDTELIITTSSGSGSGFESGSGSRHSISLKEANQSFGHFGYELEPSEMLNLNDIEFFWISQPYSSLRLLHQMGDNMFNIRWRRFDDNQHSETTYDYPLLAIETGMEL